ncbi:MAG: hypothetical protein ACRDFS_10890, partial [Chloroflexota bacterium]
PRSRGTFQVDMWADEGGPDPSGFVFEVQSKYIDRDHKVHSSSNDNYSGIKNHLIDEAYNKVLSTYNHQARAHWYDVFQVQMNKNAYWVPLWYWGDITTTDGKVPEYGTNPILPEEWNVYRWTTKASGR